MGARAEKKNEGGREGGKKRQNKIKLGIPIFFAHRSNKTLAQKETPARAGVERHSGGAGLAIETE